MSEIFSLSPSHPMPLYAQLARAIRFAIATGRLQVGEQLPTVRQLAVELRVNANTVAKVYTSWSAPASSKHEEAWERS
jgi:GntR family transcriptional regulator